MKSSPKSYIFPLLKYIAPETLLAISLLIWILSIVTIPTTYLNVKPLLEPVTLLLLNIIFFYLGMKSIKIKIKEERSKFLYKEQFLLVGTIFIGWIGTVLRAYQILFLQGYLYASNSTLKRVEMAEGELNSGILGVVTAVIQPFGFIAFLLSLYFYKKLNWKWLMVTFPLGIYPIIESFYTQGRLQFVKMILMIIFIFIFYLGHHFKLSMSLISIKFYKSTIIKLPKRLFEKKIILASIALSIGSYLFFIQVMKSRLDTFNYKNIIPVWERYQEMKLDKDFAEVVANGKEQNLEMAKYSIKHYFAHGPIEFIRMVNHVQRPMGTYFGIFTFHPYVKFFKIFGFNTPSETQLSVIIKRKSVYTTFWGPLYIDFGWFSILFSLFLGAVIKYTYLKAVNGDISHILFYSYFGFVVFGSLFVNLLNGSSLYILNALIILWLIKKY